MGRVSKGASSGCVGACTKPTTNNYMYSPQFLCASFPRTLKAMTVTNTRAPREECILYCSAPLRCSKIHILWSCGARPARRPPGRWHRQIGSAAPAVRIRTYRSCDRRPSTMVRCMYVDSISHVYVEPVSVQCRNSYQPFFYVVLFQ